MKLKFGRLDVSIPQEVQYIEGNVIRTFMICPTIGKGDCFFDSTFTEPGDQPKDVTRKAAEMRRDLCDAVQRGEYIDQLRPIVYIRTIHRFN